MIENILENFNFEKCQRVMQFLNWKWGLQGHSVTKQMLRDSAVERLKDAIKYCKESERSSNTPCWVSSGGLKATAWKNNYGHIVSIQLEFILTDWEDDGDF